MNAEQLENMGKMYESMGLSRELLDYSKKIADSLKPRFDAIDEIAEYNQMKVIAAMQKNRVSAEHLRPECYIFRRRHARPSGKWPPYQK